MLAALQKAKILGVRAGTEHRYTGVWVVVVESRVFVRSWNDKPTGWYRAFRKEPYGSIQLPDQEIPVRAKLTRSERLQQAVSRAYAEKYPTKASQKWVIGFAPERPPTNVGRLGNLVLLPEKINSRLGNTDLNGKLAEYRRSGVPLDPVLERATKWSNKEIEERTNVLAKQGYDAVFEV